MGLLSEHFVSGGVQERVILRTFRSLIHPMSLNEKQPAFIVFLRQAHDQPLTPPPFASDPFRCSPFRFHPFRPQPFRPPFCTRPPTPPLLSVQTPCIPTSFSPDAFRSHPFRPTPSRPYFFAPIRFVLITFAPTPLIAD